MKYVFYLIALFFLVPPALAQEVNIVAVVDHDIISSADVDNRIRLINVSQQNAGMGKIDPSLRPQVLDLLISERLYRKEARKLKLTLRKEEIDSAIRIVEERNRLQPGGMEKLLAANNIPYTTFKDQLEAQLLWNKVMALKVRPKIKITDDEVKIAKENLPPPPEKPKLKEVLISEIALPVTSKAEEATMKALANKLAAEIQAGKSFATTAYEYSKSPTAQNGGRVGWIVEQAIPPELGKIVSTLNNGQVSNAVRSKQGYYIVKIDDRRDALTKEHYAIKVNVKQVFVPMDFDVSASAEKQTKDKLQQLANTIKTCQDFDRVIAKAMPSESLEPLDVAIKDIMPDLQNTLLKQPVNGGATVIKSTGGLHLITVCKRGPLPVIQEEKPVVMDDMAIREMLMQKKIDGQARHYVQNLRRNAEIDIR